MVTKQVSLICIDMATDRSTLQRVIIRMRGKKVLDTQFMGRMAEFRGGRAGGYQGKCSSLHFGLQNARNVTFSDLILNGRGASMSAMPPTNLLTPSTISGRVEIFLMFLRPTRLSEIMTMR